jgi:hypothetical protein
MGFKTTAHHSTALSFLKIHMHEAPPTGTIAVQLDDLVGALTKIDLTITGAREQRQGFTNRSHLWCFIHQFQTQEDLHVLYLPILLPEPMQCCSLFHLRSNTSHQQFFWLVFPSQIIR